MVSKAQRASAIRNPSFFSKVIDEGHHFKKSAGLSLLAVPAIITLFLMCYLPMFGIIIAFKDFNYSLGMFKSPWVGFNNFKFLFNSVDAWTITRNTILYNLAYIVFDAVVAVSFAIFLNELSRRFVKAYQTILFVPFFVSWVVVGYLMLGLADPQNGVLTRLLANLGTGDINFYGEPSYWPYILIITQLWKTTGFGTLIYYTGILSIDNTYYEAAEIDGANKLQRTFFITIPMLKKLIFMLLIMNLGNIFRGDFGLHYFVPNNSGILYPVTDVIDTYTFRALRQLGNIPMSSAVTVFQSFVGLITVLIANKVIKVIDDESALF